MKQKHKFESIVAETLLIPLYYRAKESRRKNPILNDKVAEGLVDSLEYDYSRFDGAKLSEVGCVVRGWFFDRAVRRFIGKHANAVVVNVGCGLDTRFQRIGDGKAVFYDIGPAGSHCATPRADSGAAGQSLYRGLPAGNRLAGRPAPSAFRCAFYFRGRRRADVFLRKAGKGIPASCSGAFRGRRTVVRRLRYDDEPSRSETRFAP